MRVTRESPITVLDGVGRVKAEHYAKMGIYTLGDLILHYPRAYENRGDIVTLEQARPDGKSALILTVATEARVVRLRSHKSFLKFRAFDDSGSCEIVYFNQDYLKSQFCIGSVYRFFGKVERKGGKYSMSSPVAEPWTPTAELPPLWAVYRMTEGITPKQIAKDVASAFELLAAESEDPIPAMLLQKRSLCTLAYAEHNIHKPASWEALAAARRRLVYDEFFCFSLGAAITHRCEKEMNAPVCTNGDIRALTDRLPYALTGAQRRAIDDVRQDMQKNTPMSRMIVGDVGCGKTVCAAAAILISVQNGRQAAMMAPTEILARQHYADLAPIFSAMGYSCELLIGATSAAEKRRIKQALAATDPAQRTQIVIGTHALLSDGVEFAAPGLVVTDEQHRFGARQRAKLAEKNLHAHLLVMSATPIPRSLALVLYGELDLSRIDEMPPGRQKVDTFVVDETYRARLNGFIRKQIDAGGQVYVVCPAVEEQEDIAPEEITLADLDERSRTRDEKPPLKAAVNYTEEIRQAFPDLSVAFLHGKMKSAEKEGVMQEFISGRISILVSTTVIEVGVNVPNASLMIVENAERFGLSQLHQLRGRVGRGKRKSYCVLVAGGDGSTVSQTSRERLEIMHTTYDGYEIAERDLAQRGPGDFLATERDAAVRQSGGLVFRLADAGEDVSLLQDAAEDAASILQSDPTLLHHQALRAHVKGLFSLESGLIS